MISVVVPVVASTVNSDDTSVASSETTCWVVA